MGACAAMPPAHWSRNSTGEALVARKSLVRLQQEIAATNRTRNRTQPLEIALEIARFRAAKGEAVLATGRRTFYDAETASVYKVTRITNSLNFFRGGLHADRFLRQ